MSFLKLLPGGKRFLLLASIGCFMLGASAQTNTTPAGLGYVSGQSIDVTDTFKVSILGGGLNSGSYQTISPSFQVLHGFPYGIFYAPNAFDKAMFVSKGYYPDYVLLSWELSRFQNDVTFFRIYRKLLSEDDSEYTQVATVSTDATTWRDEFAEAGVMYEYKLKAEGLFLFEENFKNTLEGVGFRLPSGSVSGRVTYVDEGGAPVEGVKIIAETEDLFNSSSLYLNGTDAYLGVTPTVNNSDFQFTSSFAFQAWIKPDNTGTTPATIFQKGNQYKIEYAPGQITFEVEGAAHSLVLNFTEKTNEFFNLSAVRTSDDSLKLYVMYEDDEIFKSAIKVPGLTTTANSEGILIGKSTANTEFFKGTIDEIRIWKTAPTDSNIRINTFRIISGTERGLAAYYRLNEATGRFFYDLSREGFEFHEQHGGLVNATWSTEFPTASQLSVRGITDANGNYLITGIPFSSDGSLYTFTPAFGTHKFSPTQASRFIGPGSTTFSGVNFIDKSSFAVTGYVFYSNTKFPVSGVQVAVDGVAALSSGGSPVVTDGNGFFSLSVPIGEHQLQLVKNGHVFEGGGYFPSATTYFDFQSDFNIDPSYFKDSTLVRVIGKVVGGPVEGEKPTGFSQSINNIGDAMIVLEPQKPFDLKVYDGDSTGTWEHFYFHEGDSVVDGTITSYEIKNGTPRKLTIEPDVTTGEFFAYLLPERYNVTDLSAGKYLKSDFGNLVGATWDLSSVFIEKLEIDSALVDPSDNNSGYAIDSLPYNSKQNLVLRVNPTVKITSENKDVDRFWDDKIEIDGSEITVVSSDDYGDWLTDAPIFTQRKEYKTLISVFELYENIDNANAEDEVPVVDGEVQIQNGLAIKTARQTFELDENGEVVYSFLGGLPNTATSGSGDYLKTMSVTVFSGKGGAISTTWPSSETFAGYVLGGRPIGSDFVTTGPNIVSMILRDPHGSSSYSYYETGTSNSNELSFEFSNGEESTIEANYQLGLKTTTQTGLPGATIETEVEVKDDITIGMNQTLDWIDNTTTVHTVTNTQRWSTSDDPAFVGSNGDVFIGNATNIVYGSSLQLSLIPTTECDANAGCTGLEVNGYRIGLKNTLRFNPEFGTAFQYTQNHIENYLIPNLEFLRNEYLKSKNGTEYTSHIALNSDDFGKANTTFTRSAAGITGDSYSITYPAGFGPGSSAEYIDSVEYYNNQIQGWIDLLARNEQEKLGSTLITNYSYDAGVIFESATTVEDSKTRTETFEFTINPSVAGTVGALVNGTGFHLTGSISYNHRETKSTTTNETVTQTFGYVLADGDEGDYYSMDVRDPGSHTGPVFKVRGGQSMCPYVDEELTKYYTPGAPMSAATVRREVPQLEVENAIASDVLEGKPANFKLFLSNVADSGDDAWYRLSIDEASVTGGLVEIDGAALKDGRVFFIPAGNTLTKILSITQVDNSVTEFEDVKLVLHSLCQYDPGDNWEDIADTVAVSAYYQPACSDIQITAPDDKWLINTSQIVYDGNDISSIPLTINAGGYNLAHSSFETIAVQYKASSSSQWLTDMVYYLDQTQYDNASQPKTYLNGAASLSHILETKDLPDRAYDIRLKTTCSDGTENFSEIRSGVKDVKRPLQFGTPQPGDGILSPGEDVLLTFDEEIEAGILTQFNFSVKGVLNGQPIDHNSVLFFDGIDDHATVVEGVNLSNKSFTVEFWTRKLSDNVQGVIYSQGEIELGFSSANRFYAKLGSTTLTSTDTYTTSDNWMHWAMVYDYTAKDVAFYMNDEIALNKTSVSNDFVGNGRVFFGQSSDATNFYHGYLHDVRVWEAARGQGAIIANMSTSMRGDEVGLSGLWPMNEANGTAAYDLSRNHNAVLNGADWRVFPVGYARTFTGANQVVLPTGTIPVSDQMDMTLEFWFKASAQTNTVLFSNGRGNGDDSTPPFENIWVIGSDAAGKLYVQNNGVKLSVAKNFFDNQWHHLAIVLRRIANTTVIIDGNQEAFTASNNLGGFTGAQLALGARQFRTGGSYTFDQHFTGRIDEFRLWKLARSRDQLEMDRNAALTGDEVGLMAYLPFDAYDINQLLQPSLVSTTNEGTLTATTGGTGGTADNTDVPNLKTARPVQNVGFNWVVNDDQIIINLTDDPSVIEKTVLEITVQDIEDLNQNRLASPITWTAFVNKNTVLWDEQIINLEKQLYDELVFSVDILNLGGTDQTYEITNIPSWLTIDQPSGNLLPNSSRTLKLTIKESTNIGEYQQSLYLSSDFGFQEKFDINLRVFDEAPNWTVDPSTFEYGMSVIGILDVNGIISTDPNDMIAAVYNGEIRGVANLEYVSAYDQYMFFMDIYANQSNGETLTFKVWNADEGKVHVNVSPSLDFVNNSVSGTPSNPRVFEVRDEILVTYNLRKGWNWISFNVTSSKMVHSNQLFSGMDLTDGDLIRTIDKFDQYGESTGWIGTLSNQGGFDVYTGYKMKLDKAQTLNITGTEVKVDTVGIDLVTGWNWVSYPSTLNMEVGTAMSGLNFSNNDFIKGQDGFALYDDKLGWIGSLTFLKTTKSYLLKTASPGTLYFPNPATLRLEGNEPEELVAPMDWTLDPYQYGKSMSIVAQVDFCGQSVASGDILGAFVGDECRGYTALIPIENESNGLFFLNVYGDIEHEKVEFRYFRSTTNESVGLTHVESFKSDQLLGSIQQPVTMIFADQQKCMDILSTELADAGIAIYPNPFDEEVIIQLSSSPVTPIKLELTDITGRVILKTLMNQKEYIWDGTDARGHKVPAGIYLVHFEKDGKYYHIKIVKGK